MTTNPHEVKKLPTGEIDWKFYEDMWERASARAYEYIGIPDNKWEYLTAEQKAKMVEYLRARGNVW